ncbi:uncharacterized protein DUF998 [Actinocorallia herbida]|uniref:Uncharacterized protein DUF998 n=1 Tax=Actinocorallia herbida TaxID=58109 RepID=A0A3N1CPG7_9ACTN|nr:DUF998 domain-containing protein [Actinocorallia herbida]ROO83217.1 uncharacterized protein DUF998 [Actinocorallia herbida]
MTHMMTRPPVPAGALRTTAGACAATAFAAFALSDLAHPGYDPVAEPVSRYVNGAHGWLVTLGIAALSLAVAAVAALAGRGRVPLAWAAAGAAVAAVFPADPPGRWEAPSPSDSVHGAAAWTALILLCAAAHVVTRSLRRSTGVPLRALRACAAASTTGLVLFAVCLADRMALTHSAPLGLAERLLLAAVLAWLALAAGALREAAR